MHYAEFNEDEVCLRSDVLGSSTELIGFWQASMLREAIREYEANKWKTIGQKVGKPAKVSSLSLNTPGRIAEAFNRLVNTMRGSISGVRDNTVVFVSILSS
jgi:hypothetical protein